MNSVDEYVILIKNMIPVELCDAILEEYKNTEEWEVAGTATGKGFEEFKIDDKVRNCDTIEISQPLVINNKPNRLEIDNRLFECVTKCLDEYNKKFNHINVQEDTGYELLRYEVGGFYSEHTDSFLKAPRLVSCSLALNDNYKGGEIAFFNKERKYKLNKGDVLMFPSTFMYPHEILPVTEGVRYSIITWFR